MKKRIAFFMLMMIIGNGSVFATENIASEKKQIEENRSDNNIILERTRNEMDLLEKDIAASELELQSAEKDFEASNEEVIAGKAKLDKAENELKAKQKVFGDRLNTIYKEGEMSYIKVILEAEDILDLFIRTDMVKELVKYDTIAVEELKIQRSLVLEEKKNFEEIQNKAKKERNLAEMRKRELSNLKISKENIIEGLKESEEQLNSDLIAVNEKESNALNEIRKRDAGYSGQGSVGGGYFQGYTPNIDFTHSSKRGPIIMKATAYDPSPEQNGGYGGITALGTNLRPGVIAVDPRVIPLRSKVYIEYMDGTPFGYGVAEDTGGDIKGNRIDILFMSNNDAIRFGVKNMKVYILE